MSQVADRAFMARALQLARRGLYTCDPNPRVGCVLVKEGRVVGEGWHVRAGGPHAEIHALEAAGSQSVDASVYVTLEPCVHHGRTPPCTEALIKAGVRRVVVGMVDPNPRVAGRGLEVLQAAGIETEVGMLAEEISVLNRGFLQRLQYARPWVSCKIAASLDGRTAAPDGTSQWITSEEARRDVQRLRARASAVMCGIGTVLADDPRLNIRPSELPTSMSDAEVTLPLRVIVDSKLRVPGRARVLCEPGDVLIAAAVEAPPGRAGELGARVQIVTLPAVGGGAVDLGALMGHLSELEINEVLVEAGPTLSGALLRAGLVDELIVYLSPSLIGDRGQGMARLPGLESLDQSLRLEVVDTRQVGRDWRVTCRVGEGRA